MYYKKNRGVLRFLVKSLFNILFWIKRNKKRSYFDYELSFKNEKVELFFLKIFLIGIELLMKNGKIWFLGIVSKSDDIILIGKLNSVWNRDDSVIWFIFIDIENLLVIGVDGVEE